MNIRESIPYKGIRKIIGERMVKSFANPHHYQNVSIDMSKTIAKRKEINSKGEVKLSINDFVVRATALALAKTPIMNSAMGEKEINVFEDINLSVIVAMDKGLMAPVLKNADKKDIYQISRELNELYEKARAGKLMPDDYADSTFTISNVGMLKNELFMPIMFPNQAAILGVSAIIKKPVVIEENGEDVIAVRPMMNITTAADHRIVDGVPLAAFNCDIKEMLENPDMLV
ncbi:MAG: 2-oxo acid dehydrogenase subunit E2 [Christensenellaceae bacterium]|nr:2-oxo acid dehydrogenase subunit E2 [Christensenellaceae bacterium]